MEIAFGSPGKTRKLIIWISWPADCLASWLAGWLEIPGKAKIQPWRSFWWSPGKQKITDFGQVSVILYINSQPVA